MRYQLKPVRVDAVQLNAKVCIIYGDHEECGDVGDWLVTDAKGRHSIVHSGVFAQQYEPAD